MSILINMEMPKNCSKCAFGDGYACYVTNLKVQDDDWENTRASFCPLIEVQQHGRLIDADALRLLYDFKGYKPTGDMTEEEFDKLMCRLPVIRQNIDDMPTIIEAEVEDG